MARPYRLALVAAGAALVVGALPLAAGALAARSDTVCLDTWATPRTAPSSGLDPQQRNSTVQANEAARAESGLFVEGESDCMFATRAPHPFSTGAAWIAVLLASAAAGAAAWWLASGARPETVPAAGAAATRSPPAPPPSPVGPVTLTPFGAHGGYVDLPHGVVVWATQDPSTPTAGGGLRPGEPVAIRPGATRGAGWIVGRDTLTPGACE